MNQAEIEAFLAIVEQGSLSGAADSLYLTQSALSSRLENLEKETGARLVKRKKGVRKIELTEAGSKMVALARKWSALYEETRTFAVRPERTRLRISVVQSVQAYLMGSVYDSFLTACPQCDLHLMSLDSERTYQMLEKGELEAALIGNPRYSSKVAGIPLFREEMYFVCSKEASYSGTVHPSELSPEHEIYMRWHPDYQRWHTFWFGRREYPRIETDSMQLMEHFLEEKEKWTILPLSAVQKLQQKKEIKVLPIQDGPGARVTYLLLKERETWSQELKFLLLLLKEHLLTRNIEWLAEEQENFNEF